MSGQGQARRWKARTISAEHPLVDDEHLPLILKPMDIPEIPKRPASLSKASSHASLKLVLYCVPFATSYVMYDVMAAMSVPVKAEMNLNNAQLGMIFSSYSIPNMFMPLLVGVLSSHEAFIWKMALLLMFGVTVGSALSSAATIWASFPLLAAGRLLTGMCTESFYVAGDALMSSWFGDESLGLAFGVAFAFGEVGGALPFYVGSLLHRFYPDNYYKILFVGTFGAGCVSFACLLIIYALDRKRHQASVRRAVRSTPVRSVSEYGRWVYSVIRRQSRMFWLLFGQCACLYGAFYTFLVFCTDFLTNTCGMSKSLANIVAGAIPLASLVLSPVSGYFLTSARTRNPIVALLFAAGGVCVGLLSFSSSVNPIYPLIGISIGSGTIPGCLWSTIAEISRENEFSILYGLIGCACNITLAVAQYVAGALSVSSSSADEASVSSSSHNLASFRVRDNVFQMTWWFICGIMGVGCMLALASWYYLPKQFIEREKSRSFDEILVRSNSGRFLSLDVSVLPKRRANSHDGVMDAIIEEDIQGAADAEESKSRPSISRSVSGIPRQVSGGLPPLA